MADCSAPIRFPVVLVNYFYHNGSTKKNSQDEFFFRCGTQEEAESWVQQITENDCAKSKDKSFMLNKAKRNYYCRDIWITYKTEEEFKGEYE